VLQTWWHHYRLPLRSRKTSSIIVIIYVICNSFCPTNDPWVWPQASDRRSEARRPLWILFSLWLNLLCKHPFFNHFLQSTIDVNKGICSGNNCCSLTVAPCWTSITCDMVFRQGRLDRVNFVTEPEDPPQEKHHQGQVIFWAFGAYTRRKEYNYANRAGEGSPDDLYSLHSQGEKYNPNNGGSAQAIRALAAMKIHKIAANSGPTQDPEEEKMMKTNKTRPRVLFYYPMLTYSVAPPNSLHFHCFFGKPKKNEKWKRERLHERNCACLKHSNLFKVIESLNETIHVVKPHLFCFLFSFSFHFFKPPPWEEGEREREREKKERKKERKKISAFCFLCV